jgi:hypothetical protein
MSGKPIDLIVANIMHESHAVVSDFHARVDHLRRVAKLAGYDADINELGFHGGTIADEIARKLLCQIAHDARIADIYVALASVKAPASAEMIKEGLQAVKDRQAT